MPRRVLVVDDNPAVVSLISDSLREAGFEVLSATNGAEALAVVENDCPEAVILDLVMPVVDGMKVLRTLRGRAATQYLPVILLTGKDGHGAVLEGWMGGADRYITKPCSMQEILSAIEEMLTAPVKHEP